jgi:hypothetical protein
MVRDLSVGLVVFVPCFSSFFPIDFREIFFDGFQQAGLAPIVLAIVNKPDEVLSFKLPRVISLEDASNGLVFLATDTSPTISFLDNVNN